MVFKSMRGSLFIMAPTSTFSIPTRCIAQDHPAYIPRRSRAATDHRPVTIRPVGAGGPSSVVCPRPLPGGFHATHLLSTADHVLGSSTGSRSPAYKDLVDCAIGG